MEIKINDIEITVEFDEDGFPVIDINTGNNYYGGNFRPTVEINLNNKTIHEMFEDDDNDAS